MNKNILLVLLVSSVLITNAQKEVNFSESITDLSNQGPASKLNFNISGKDMANIAKIARKVVLPVASQVAVSFGADPTKVAEGSQITEGILNLGSAAAQPGSDKALKWAVKGATQITSGGLKVAGHKGAAEEVEKFGVIGKGAAKSLYVSEDEIDDAINA
jgi:hypothetical protein